MARCPRCLKHEARIERLEATVERYADLLLRVGAKSHGVDARPIDWGATVDQGPEIPPSVRMAIAARSQPNTPEYRALASRAIEMLEGGVTDSAVAEAILDGEPVDAIL